MSQSLGFCNTTVPYLLKALVIPKGTSVTNALNCQKRYIETAACPGVPAETETHNFLSFHTKAEYGPELVQRGHFDVVKRLTSQLTCVPGQDALSGSAVRGNVQCHGPRQDPFWMGGGLSSLNTKWV